MGDEILLKSKQLTAEIESKNAAYMKWVDVPSDLEEKMKTLLETKEKLEADRLLFYQQQMIWKELEMPPQQMMTGDKIEKDMAESEEILSESKVVYEQNLTKIETTKQLTLEALNRREVSLHELRQKMAMLEDKYASTESEWQDAEPCSREALNPTANKLAKQQILLLLENAKEVKKLVEDRQSRLDSLLQVAERASTCIRTEVGTRIGLDRLREKLSGLEFMSGIKCKIIDDLTVTIQFVDLDHHPRLPDDSRLSITLGFVPDDSQCLQLDSVNTSIKIPEVEDTARCRKLYQDLPKLIHNLRTAWLSYVTLTAEVSSLRECHAIDWHYEGRVFHLMIDKYICRLCVPPSYPCGGGHVTLEQIMGGPSNLNSVTPPRDLTLTGWVTHLENILT